jgi:hypothetical protein
VIPKTHTVVPFLLAMLVAVAGMPTNVFQICLRSVGTLEVEPWLARCSSAVARAVTSAALWMRLLLGLRAPVCAAAVLLALMAADLSASHAAMLGVLVAIPPVAVTAMTAEQLRSERAQLVATNDGLRPANGVFETDEVRQSFDANTSRIAAIDVRLRELEATAAPVPAGSDAAAARAAGAQAERERVTAITDAVRVAKLDASLATDMIGRGITVEAARTEIFAKLAAQSAADAPVTHLRVGEDGRDAFLRDATNWLILKSGMAPDVARATKVDVNTITPGAFRGMSLLDLARECLKRHNRPVGFDKMRIVADAFTFRSTITQSTSDFATLLENVMHKMLQAAYGITPDTWSRFCATGSVSDFRAHNRYRHGSFGSLDTVAENGEFKRKAISDGEKESLTASTKGNIINVSRQMIINDDIGVFTGLLAKLGRAAKLSIEVDVYALLAQNSGDGPTMSDGVALFHTSSHGANKTTGAALTAAALDLDRVAMASQRDPNSNEYLDLRPAVLVLPVGLGGQARVINQSQYDPDTVANKSQMKPNVVVGLFRDIVDTPRIAGTRRYLFADPSVAPVIEVAFLEGQSEPVLETRDGWNVDGTEMKVRLDYAVGAVDWRGAVTNAGA